MRLQDLTGRRFGRLVAISLWGYDKFDKVLWLCRCDCGKACSPTANKLTVGETRSCGCLHDEAAGNRLRTHGGKGTRVYNVWASAKGRCSNPTDPVYKNYGGRGITMCPAWRASFAQFLADMGPRPEGGTLDRIDNDGPYSPENCRWATRTEQCRNQRKTKRFTYRGESLTLGEWSARTKLAESALYYRIKEAGWTIERALTTPSVTGGNKPTSSTL